MAIDLNAPAFGPNAQKVEDLNKPEQTAEPAVAEPAKVEEVETPVEETKVPYSRFKKFHDRALEAEEEAARWRAEAERYAQTTKVEQPESDMPSYWRELYGDSDASKKAWSIQKQAYAELREETRKEALEAVRNERLAEVERTEQNIEVLDENFEDLQALVGRELTDKEQAAILDIVDDYTPKDREGNYAGALMPFDKAWEIYELKNQASKIARTTQRDNVAGLTGTRRQGEPDVKAEQDKNWNPLDWNAWKKKL